MNTPLHRAVEAYLAAAPARFHMPGHKGAPISPVGAGARYDITEVPGADSLYEANGPIAEAEARYAALYGAGATLFSAGGSTLCIQAMLALAVPAGAAVLCARGVHGAAVNAMALLGLSPVWLYPESDPQTGLASAVTAEQVRGALAAHPEIRAVYLTSPSYFGVLCDIAAIAQVCRARGVPLLVDNAHGAHLRFLCPDRHPISQGADFCCDSLHKTLPVLTGGALLHLRDAALLPDARRSMSLFGSTSPSYLILLSIDGALPYLEQQAEQDLARVAAEVAALQALADARGFCHPGGERDPLRLALGFAPLGLTAAAMRALLDTHRVEPEYLSDAFCVLLAGGQNTPEEFLRLRGMLAAAPAPTGAPPAPLPPLPRPTQAMCLREAMLAPAQQIPLHRAAGRVCAGMVAPCPPGIPLVVAGERLDEIACTVLERYGVLSVNVVK